MFKLFNAPDAIALPRYRLTPKQVRRLRELYERFHVPSVDQLRVAQIQCVEDCLCADVYQQTFEISASARARLSFLPDGAFSIESIWECGV